MPDPLELRIVAALQRAVDDAREHDGGELASYIPELARVDPTPIGIAAAGLGESLLGPSTPEDLRD